jgi:hypothetical protein
MPNDPSPTTPATRPRAGALVVAAATGMLLGCGGASAANGQAMTGGSVIVQSFAPAPSDAPLPGAKDCCRAKNACRGQSGCLTESNALGAGKNECRTKGTSCPKPT